MSKLPKNVVIWMALFVIPNYLAACCSLPAQVGERDFSTMDPLISTTDMPDGWELEKRTWRYNRTQYAGSIWCNLYCARW